MRSSTNRKSFARGRRWAKPLDHSTTGQAFRQPGIDPRQWLSIGLVTAGNQTDEIVVFDEDEGQPYVRVLLEPTKVPVRARVGGMVAGNGEAEWHPFVEGDEVLVAIPEGDERAGCIIIARLSNGIDKFPMESVAGQDPTTNTFGFRRRRTPYIEEFNGPLIFRSALTGSLLSFDTGGAFTVRTGDASVFQMSPDVIGFQGPSDEETPPDMMMQINLTDRHLSFTIGDAIFNLSASDATPEPNNIISVQDNLTISAGGNAAAEHLATVEATWHSIAHILNQIGIALGASNPGPLTGATLATALSLAGTPAPMSLAAPAAAATGANPAVGAALSSSFAAMSSKSPAVFQLQPGLGSATILTG